MSSISYSKTNENLFLYIDSNSKINIMDGQTNVDYTQAGRDKITAIAADFSSNDEFILYESEVESEGDVDYF